MKEELRKLLRVPKEIRIAQHIYNCCREYEQKLDVMVKQDGKYIERGAQGIDIFYVKDDEFISLFFK